MSRRLRAFDGGRFVDDILALATCVVIQTWEDLLQRGLWVLHRLRRWEEPVVHMTSGGEVANWWGAGLRCLRVGIRETTRCSSASSREQVIECGL